ncbi:MAG TPA: ComEC/Rec2 family competence protein [Candidatus Onthovivens sp.]|nr:ComEC/Rec2 family competence protein [Candidatus Onthovivens sp.]
MKFFAIFLIFIASLLLFDVKTFLLGLIFFIIGALLIFKREKKNKKLIIFTFIIATICALRINIDFNIPNKSAYNMIVIEKKDKYFIGFDGVEKFYVKTDKTDIDQFDIIYTEGHVKKINFSSLESAFNFEEYLRGKNITKEFINKTIINKFDFPIQFNAYKETILNNFDDENVKSIVSSMLFNTTIYDSEILMKAKSMHMLHIFSQTGIFISFFIYFLIKLLKLRFSEKKANLIALILFAPFLLYNILDFTIIRVLIFFIFRYFNKFHLKNKYSKIEQISLIGILFLIIDPFVINNAGFYLSFLIQTVMYFSYLLLAKKRKFTKQIIIKTIIFLLVLPFTLTINHSLNFINSILGFIFLPIFKVIFVILQLSFFNFKIPFFEQSLVFFFKFLFNSRYEILNINLPPFDQIGIFFYFLIFFTSFYFLEINFKKVYKICLFSGITCFVLYCIPLKNSFTYQVSYINVGQGDSTLIRYRNHVSLIDTGGLKYTDVAKNSLIPFLRKNRIYKIDNLFLTHDDYDHTGAVESLQRDFKINNIYNYDNFINYKDKEMEFINLNTSKNYWEDENDKSLVLYNKIKNFSFLFMGDASKSVEEMIIKEYPNLTCDYLKVGHHGSNTSSSDEFINMLSPQYAIISCGENNIYKHPHQATIDVLNKYHIKIRRTDLEGTITFNFVL